MNGSAKGSVFRTYLLRSLACDRPGRVFVVSDEVRVSSGLADAVQREFSQQLVQVPVTRIHSTAELVAEIRRGNQRAVGWSR